MKWKHRSNVLDYFLSLYGNEDCKREIANHTFDRIAGEGADSLNPEWIDRDLKKLATMSEAIKKYTDKRIAHYDQARLKQPVPTFTDLEEALKALEELVLHYWLVTKAVTVAQLLPTFQFDWKEVFYFPWIDSPRLHDH